MKEAKLRQLGRTGIKVFPLGFGGIPIQRLTMEEAVKVVRKAIELGINFIDTSRAYSDSEEKIGESLKDINDRVYLASKTKATNKEEAINDIDLSLKQLGVEKIDVYQLHAVNDIEDYQQRVLAVDSALAGLKEARQQGKIDFIGISSHSNQILLKALETDEFDTIQFCYNFIENDCEKELLKAAREHNVGMIGMKPLAGGRLNNASVALKYVLAQEGVVPDPGIEKIEELEENVAIAKGTYQLTEQERAVMDKLKGELGDLFCRRCGYCQPCPQGINISVVVRAESFIRRMPKKALEGVYQDILKAENCLECEICVDRCPYNLPIPRLIKENIKIMQEYRRSQSDFNSEG